MPTQKMRREENPRARGLGWGRERELWLLFLYVFLSPRPVLCKLGQPGMLLVLPEVLTPVLGPSFVLFLRAFPFLVFWPPPFWTLFPYSAYLTHPSSLSFYYSGRANGEGLPLIDNWILKWERVAKVAQLSFWASYQIVWGSRLTVQHRLHCPPFCSHLDLLFSVCPLTTQTKRWAFFRNKSRSA